MEAATSASPNRNFGHVGPPAGVGAGQSEAQAHERGLADGAAVNELPGSDVAGIEYLVVVHAEAHRSGFGPSEQVVALLDGQGHGLLDQHVLAGLDDLGHRRMVQVVGQPDGDRIHVGVGQQIGSRAVAGGIVGADRLVDQRGVDVGDRRDPAPAGGLHATKVELADVAEADDADTDVAVCHCASKTGVVPWTLRLLITLMIPSPACGGGRRPWDHRTGASRNGRIPTGPRRTGWP